LQAKKVGSEKGQKQKSLAPHYSPKTTNQKAYWKYLNDPNVSIVLGTGPAGTGKTLFACNTAIQLLKRGDIQKIVLTRPVVAVEEDLGFLPGNLVMKMDPWTRPIFDILLEFYSQKDVDAMVQSGVIEISPLAYMRGRTFKRAFIIADEMQNSSPNQMMMLTTRIGEGSKMVITGDLKQSDRSADNGLLDLMQKLRGFRLSKPEEAGELRIRAVEMSMEDVERSAVVKQVLALYETPAYRVVPNHGISNGVVANHVISNHFISQEVVRDVIANAVANADMVAVSENPINEDTETNETPSNEDTPTNEDPANEDPANNGAFELVTYDDAALIPKKHISKHMPGNEDYHHYSSRKWSGW
jgi:phosphate starvation-inducible PhoH-like protein